MRLAILALPLCLAACANWTEPTGAFFAADAASVVVFHRGFLDILFSFATGKDCSIVRLDQGKTYCKPPAQVRREPFCTRSLGYVDCWADPDRLPAPYRPVGDAPEATPLQKEWRNAPWPKQVNAGL